MPKQMPTQTQHNSCTHVARVGPRCALVLAVKVALCVFPPHVRGWLYEAWYTALQGGAVGVESLRAPTPEERSVGDVDLHTNTHTYGDM